MPSSPSSERPSPATEVSAACLPAPAAAGQGVGTQRGHISIAFLSAFALVLALISLWLNLRELCPSGDRTGGLVVQAKRQRQAAAPALAGGSGADAGSTLPVGNHGEINGKGQSL